MKNFLSNSCFDVYYLINMQPFFRYIRLRSFCYFRIQWFVVPLPVGFYSLPVHPDVPEHHLPAHGTRELKRMFLNTR
jgi:hypothetical protein